MPDKSQQTQLAPAALFPVIETKDRTEKTQKKSRSSAVPLGDVPNWGPSPETQRTSEHYRVEGFKEVSLIG